MDPTAVQPEGTFLLMFVGEEWLAASVALSGSQRLALLLLPGSKPYLAISAENYWDEALTRAGADEWQRD